MNLPTQSLSFQSVIQFAPGARYEPLQNSGSGPNNGFQINGASNSENSYLVDGQETANILDGHSARQRADGVHRRSAGEDQRF